MQLALRLAEQAVGLSDPNPRVGCVITDASRQQVLGQGYTQVAGGPHAEVMALRDAQSRGLDVRGATAFVTLEPCAHHGRTPPCCDALIAAGLSAVVVAVEDPNPKVCGQGIARMRAAGLSVTLADEASAQLSRELNIGFFSRMTRQRPWVRLKMAMSLDGRTALPDGQSQWITGEAARRDGHAWRRRAGAVLTGHGTVRADDPRLDVRLVPTARQPLRVVLDARLDTPASARLFDADDASPLLFFAANPSAARLADYQARGVEVVSAPSADGRVNLAAVVAELTRREVNELHLETGARLAGAWLAQDRVDELLLFQAPMLIGPGRALAELPTLTALAQASRWSLQDVQPLGPDLRLRLRKPHA